ncbi:hypothetical protein WICPIJ_001329 [Wickerhamomyces pijperi]|uniref:Arrestin-like N-terminal domain-containing protein n=1 Tax=Wickerhamomyces pijperi TaxID=599730 RepID=A0A9P8TQR2_WICPI|nr:hypothetical protein WICPIJ_001329 [Wickerhamomyces pijperi]
MSAPELQPPLYSPKRLSTCAHSPKLPSKSSIKALKVEIRVDNEQEYYQPGQEIHGSVEIYQTDKKKINDFLFNDVEITFQNRLDSKLLDNSTKFLFKQEDSPKIDLSMNYNKDTFVFKKAVSYPFKFIVPKLLLDNSCPYNYDIHRNLMPSFGLPSQCGLRFNSKNVHYDADKDPMLDSYFDLLEPLSFKKFMNSYYINVLININLESPAQPLPLFQRNKEIRIKNDPVFDDLSKSYISLSSRYALQLAEYYNLFETNALNEMKFDCSMKVVNPADKGLGLLTLKSPLPMLLAESTKESLPLDLTFHSNQKEHLAIPEITVDYEMNQYLVQSSKCFKPMGFNLSILDKLQVNSKTLRMEIDDNEVFFMKVQTLFQRSHHVQKENWTPVYNEENTYDNHFQIGLPPVAKNKFTQSTFHHCLMQNIYALKVSVSYRFHNSSSAKNDNKTSLKPSNGRKLSMFAKSKKSSSSSAAAAVNAAESPCDERNSMTLYIPITLL